MRCPWCWTAATPAPQRLPVYDRHQIEEAAASRDLNNVRAPHLVRSARAFDTSNGDGVAVREREIERLYAKTGQLMVERDFWPRGPEDEGPDRRQLVACLLL